MKKVAIIYSGARYQGGVEVYLKNLFKYYDKKKVELVFVSLGEWPLTKKIKDMKHRTMVISGSRMRPQTFFDIKRFVESEDISLIVSQGVVANFYARGGARLAHVPHLTTVHSDLKAEYSNALIRCLYSFSDFLTRPLTKKYIAASNYLKKVLISRGVEKGKVQVIYHGVEPQATSHKPQDTKKKEIVIGSLGRLDKVKGYTNLIKAFSLLDNMGVRLVIWGEGRERNGLEALVKELGLQDKVDMPGYTDSDEAFSQMDIYIQSSLSEGLGLSVLEAMFARKPVIVTPAGALKEIVEDGKTGFVAENISPESIAGAIKRALAYKEIQGIVDNAEKQARDKFSVEKSVEDTVNVYIETIA